MIGEHPQKLFSITGIQKSVADAAGDKNRMTCMLDMKPETEAAEKSYSFVLRVFIPCI